jgi:hypothetical protein
VGFVEPAVSDRYESVLAAYGPPRARLRKDGLTAADGEDHLGMSGNGRASARSRAGSRTSFEGSLMMPSETSRRRTDALGGE